MNYGNYLEELLRSDKNFNAYGISFQSNYDSSYSFFFLPTALWRYLYLNYLPYEEREGQVLDGILLLDREIEHEVVNQKWNLLLDKSSVKDIELQGQLMSTKDKQITLQEIEAFDKLKLTELFRQLQAGKIKHLHKELVKQAVKAEGIFSYALKGTLQIGRIEVHEGNLNGAILHTTKIKDVILTEINECLRIIGEALSGRSIVSEKSTPSEIESLHYVENAEVENEAIFFGRWINLFRTTRKLSIQKLMDVERQPEAYIMRSLSSQFRSLLINIETLSGLLGATLEKLNGLKVDSIDQASPQINEVYSMESKNVLTRFMRDMSTTEEMVIGLMQSKESETENKLYEVAHSIAEIRLSIVGWFERAVHEMYLGSTLDGYKKDTGVHTPSSQYTGYHILKESEMSNLLGMDYTLREIVVSYMQFSEIEQLIGLLLDIIDMEKGIQRDTRLNELIESYKDILRETESQLLLGIDKTKDNIFVDRRTLRTDKENKEYTVPKDGHRYIKDFLNYQVPKLHELRKDIDRDAVPLGNPHSLVRLPLKGKINLTEYRTGKLMKEISIINSGVFETSTEKIFTELASEVQELIKKEKGIINSEISTYEYSHKIPYIIREILTTDPSGKKFTQSKPFEFLDRMIRQIIAREGLDKLESENKEVLAEYLLYHLEDKLKKELVHLENTDRLDKSNKEISIADFLFELEEQMIEMRIMRQVCKLDKVLKDSKPVEYITGISEHRRDVDVLRDKNNFLKTWKKIYISRMEGQLRQILEIDRTHVERLDSGPREILDLVILLQLSKKIRQMFLKENLIKLGKEQEKYLEASDVIALEKDDEYLIDLSEIQHKLEKLDKTLPEIQGLLKNLQKGNKEIFGPDIKRVLQFIKEKYAFVDKFYQLTKDTDKLIEIFQELLVDRDDIKDFHQLEQELADKLKHGELLQEYEVDKLKEILIELGFVFDEMYRRWYFMPSDGPYDDPLVPNENWDYTNNPINGFIEDPLPGAGEGKGRILVDLNILKNAIDFMELLFRSNLTGYAGCTPEQAIKHFVTSLFDWLDHQIPDVEDKIPEFYPDAYERYDNPNMEGRDDYWKIFRHIRWYSEGILNNISESEKTDLKGAKYVRKIIDRMIEYYKDHHSDSEMELDKFKGFRRRGLQSKNKLLKKEEI